MSRRSVNHPGVQCQFCGSQEMRKAGRNRSGSQKYECKRCGQKTTPEPKPRGHGPETRQKAVQMLVEGLSQRQVARMLQVSPQSVRRWRDKYVTSLPPQPPMPATSEVTELDELYTFAGSKKTDIT